MGVMSISFKQLSLFAEEVDQCTIPQVSETTNTSADTDSVSARLLDAFGVSDIPFMGCDFETLYPNLKTIVPSETVLFDYADINTLIACETACAAICHQMNWDFLRNAIFQKVKLQPAFLSVESLSNISSLDVRELLEGYGKPERIRSSERADILRNVGRLAMQHGNFVNLFFDENGKLLTEAQIRSNLLESTVFSQDPEEKKLQLLLQKLSNYAPLAELQHYCKPAIDYHLIRCFLRRGLLYPKNKRGTSFISDPEARRQEQTVGALRQLCATLICEISNYTSLSINDINQIEWHIGRSICKEGVPDCCLAGEDAKWVSGSYDRCPFYSTCCAVNYNPELLLIEEPKYTGNSY